MEIVQPEIVQIKGWDDKIYNDRSFPPVEVEMGVPSGKIIVMNDIREFWPEAEDETGFDLNATLGLKATTEAYGKYGMFHGFVGNSCPGVWKNGDLYYIGNEGHDWDTDEVVEPIDGELVAGVCTDLWWYCIADLDDYLARGGKIHKHYCDIVDVTPGRYVLKHYYAITNKEYHGSGKREVFATFERSDEPLNTYFMPEEPLYREIPRILSEIHHFSHEYRWKSDEFKLLLSIRGGRHERYKPRPEIPTWNWYSYWYMLGKLVSVKIPAELVNHGHYDEISVEIKKQVWRKRRRDLQHKQMMREMKRDQDKMTPEEKKAYQERQRVFLDEILAELKEMQGE
jgi:hypothetical protein